MSNSTLDAIFSRRSVRAYTEQKVDAEVIELIAKAALAAPSGMNAQPVNVIVVDSKELLLEMEKDVIDHFVKAGNTAVVERMKSRNNKVLYDAPVAYVLAVKNNSSADVGIMAQNICIAATSLGLGSIILGMPGAVFEAPESAAKWNEKLGMPEGYKYGLAVAVGYAADEGKPHEIDLGKLSFVK